MIGLISSTSIALWFFFGLLWGRLADRTGRPDRIVLLGGVGSSLGPALAQLNHLVRDGLGPAAPRCFEIACGRSDRFGAALGTAWAAAAFR